jgi:hypothetical protein
MANLRIICVVAGSASEAEESPPGATPSPNVSSTAAVVSTAIEVLPVAAIERVPVGWHDVLSFSPDAFVFASANAVKCSLEGAEAPILLARWRGAVFGAVGASTAAHLEKALRRVFAGKPPEVVWPPGDATGLEALLAALPQKLVRVVAFGATGGKAESIHVPGRELLAAPCYAIVPSDEASARIASALNRWRADSNPEDCVEFEVGAASVADALCDALETLGILAPPPPPPPWLKFLPRHASAHARLRERVVVPCSDPRASSCLPGMST